MLSYSTHSDGITFTVTYDPKRDPMFMDSDGRGWVPIARFMELHDALRRLVELKDGPRDEEYERSKPVAWAVARDVL